MTRVEALKLIKSDGIYSQEVMDALQEPFNANQHNSNALNALEGDAISRQAVDEIKELMTDINGDTVYAVRMSNIRQLSSVNPQERTGHCKDCKSFREIPFHIDTCIQHTELCPKGDWYCADFEPQESDNCN